MYCTAMAHLYIYTERLFMETDETTVSHCLEIVLESPVMAQVLIYHLGLNKNGITETKMIFASRASSENDYLVLWLGSLRDIGSL